MLTSAVIGCGRIASLYDASVPLSETLTHAGAYSLCPHTQLIAAADSDEKRLKDFGKKWKVRKLYPNYEEMLQKEKIDILSLCLPTELHFEAFRTACDHGVPAIFCEKPLSYQLDEAEKITEMAGGKVVSVNYFRRWNPSVEQLQETLRMRPDDPFHGTVRYTKGLFGNASHLVDLVTWFFGEPVEIATRQIYENQSGDLGADFSFLFGKDRQVHFLHIPNADYVFIDVDLLTSKERWVLSQRGQKIEKYERRKAPYYESFDILEPSRLIETEWKNCTLRAVQEIVGCLRSGRSQTRCTPSEALKTLRLCQRVLELQPSGKML